MYRADNSTLAGRRPKAAPLLTGCALGLVLAALPQAAQAQAFQGIGAPVVGSATISTGPNSTSIALASAETVINWTPTDVVGTGTIDFLPAGTTASFISGSDFTVLNRILPIDSKGNPAARPVAFNGSVSGQVGSSNGPGGNIWFYTPTGIVVGPTATFNVGGLVLTTDDIVFGKAATGGTELYGPGNTVMFRGPSGSTGFVDVQAGSQINAASYIALVAPRVQQGGTASADGPIAYVGAEQVDLSINAGLFDISILAGTGDANGIVHTGTTGGPASTAATDQQQIMMVAMPKATALTMLLSGSIGYTPAATASNDGSSVILSAGYDRPVPAAETADSLGRIALDDANFTNPTSAYATGRIDLTGASGPVTFGSDASLFAQDVIAASLASGQQVTAAGGLWLGAGRTGVGGTIDISVGGKGKLSAVSSLNLNASSYPVPFGFSSATNATGGTISVDVNGGTLSAASILSDVSAFGGYDPAAGGTAVGGAISFTARGNGIISTGALSAVASAYGGDSDAAGGAANAGSLNLASHNGALDLDSLYLEARAQSGNGGVIAGIATGGNASIVLDGGSYDWTDIAAYTDAFGGYTSNAQANSVSARSDAIDLSLINGAALGVTDGIDLSANAYGAYDAPAGSSVRAGGIGMSVTGGSSLAFTDLKASAQAAVKAPFRPLSSATAPARTADTFGGAISLTADSGSLTGGSISLISNAAELAASAAAGTATGGSVDVNVLNGGSLRLDNGSATAAFVLRAHALGAVGHSAANAVGGRASMTVADGSVDVLGTIDISANGAANDLAAPLPAGPDPLVGFNATGGTASLQLLAGSSGTAHVSSNNLLVSASGNASTPAFFYVGDDFIPAGTYGGPFAADGGTGSGGTARTSVGGGALSVGSATVTADGYGGLSAESGTGTPFRSGDGRGGSADMTVDGGSSTVADLHVTAAGTGGNGSATGPGGTVPSLAGDGFGGSASATFTGGILQVASLAVDASGTGGAGGDGPDDLSLTPGTDGGKGAGGTARLISSTGSAGQLISPSVSLLATGTGGAGGQAAMGSDGNGGNGIGGTAAADLADASFKLGPLTIKADGFGGDGLVGGEGSGGTAKFVLGDSVAGPSGLRTIDGLQLNADGAGGTGSGGTAQSDAGLAQLTLNATGLLTINGDLRISAQGSRSAAGDGFTGSFSGEPVQVTGDATIVTTRDATITATTPLQSAGNLQITARKLSGTGQLSAGGSATVIADQGIALGKLSAGTTTTLQAANGAVLIATDLESGGNVSATGRSIDITSLGTLAFISSQATAGGLRVATVGNLTLATPSATGAVDLSSSNGTLTVNGALTSGADTSASGTNGVSLAAVSAGGAIMLTSANGTVSASGNVSSGGAFGASGFGGVAFGNLTSGATTSLSSSNGAATVTNLVSAGAVTALARSLDIASTGALAFSSIAASGGGARISTAGNLALGGGDVFGALTLTSTSGAISSGGAVTAGGAVSANGASGVGFNRLNSGATTSLVATGGNVAVADLETGGEVTARGRDVNIRSLGGGLNFDSATATAGNVFIRTAGDLTAQAVAATGGADLASTGGNLHALGDVAGTAVTLAAAGNVVADANLSVSGALGIDAGGTFALAGTARGTVIGVSSGDIQLGTAALLGVRGTTQTLTLTSRNGGRVTYVGGAAQTGGYSLDAAEASRLFADKSIAIAAAGDAVVGNLQLSFAGTGNVGTGGRLELTSPGKVEVSGAVDLRTSSASDTFTIDPTRIDVIAGEGSIAMRSSSGAAQGTIDLTAGAVGVLSRSTRDTISGLTDLGQISRLLGTPAPAGPFGGYLVAGTIRITADNAFLVQNGGAGNGYADRRGFTANALEITTGSANTQIAINGVILQNGVPVTGLSTTPLVTIDGQPAAAGGKFNPLSTINGCVIGADCRFRTPDSGPVAAPTDDDLTPPVTPDNPLDGTFSGTLIQLEDYQPLISPPLVDEPITGVGNDDLWLVQCDPQKDGCPQTDKGQ